MSHFYKEYSKYGFRRGQVRKCYKSEPSYPKDPKDSSIRLKKCAANIPTLKQWESMRYEEGALTPNGRLWPAFIAKGQERKLAYILAKKQRIFDLELDTNAPISLR